MLMALKGAETAGNMTSHAGASLLLAGNNESSGRSGEAKTLSPKKKPRSAGPS
jgi:hypothetical protein